MAPTTPRWVNIDHLSARGKPMAWDYQTINEPVVYRLVAAAPLICRYTIFLRIFSFLRILLRMPACLSGYSPSEGRWTATTSSRLPLAAQVACFLLRE